MKHYEIFESILLINKKIKDLSASISVDTLSEITIAQLNEIRQTLSDISDGTMSAINLAELNNRIKSAELNILANHHHAILKFINTVVYTQNDVEKFLQEFPASDILANRNKLSDTLMKEIAALSKLSTISQPHSTFFNAGLYGTQTRPSDDSGEQPFKIIDHSVYVEFDRVVKVQRVLGILYQLLDSGIISTKTTEEFTKIMEQLTMYTVATYMSAHVGPESIPNHLLEV